MSKISEFVRAVRLHLDLSQEQLGERFGLSKASVSAWETDKSLPTYEAMMKLFEMSKASIPLPFFTPQIDRTTNIPLYGGDTLMDCNRASDVANETPDGSIPGSQSASPAAFAYKITDKTMEPTLLCGDFIILDPNKAPEPGSLVLAQISGEVMVRRYKHRGYTHNARPLYELAPENDNFPSHLSSAEPVGILGVVTEIRRTLT